MEILKIEILDSKAGEILNEMEAKRLIRVLKPEVSKKSFLQLLKNLRQNDIPSFEEIQNEVRAVRRQMSQKE